MNTLPRITAGLVAAAVVVAGASAASADETSTATPVAAPEPSYSASPTATPSPTASASASPSASETASPGASEQATATASATASATATSFHISSTTTNPTGLAVDGGAKQPKVVDFATRAGVRETVPASTNWASKDASVVSETASQVVADADGPVRQVATVDNVAGKPVITITPVSSASEAQSVVAREQKQSETVAVSVPSLVSVDGQYEPKATAPYYWSRTTSSDTSRAIQDQVRDFTSSSVFANAAATSNIEYAWAKGRGQGVIVAVVDTGVDGTHPDLAGQVLPGYDFVTGATGATAGWKADHPHGTHVAGIIAAKDGNGIGITGVAPDVKILPIKVLDSTGSGTSATVARGIVAAVDAGAHIINLSLGSPEPDPVLQTAVEYAVSNGVLVIAAGGNLGMPGYLTLNGWNYPASYPGVIGVAAGWSDCGGIGGDHIDIAAPGCDILSTIPGGGYARYSGTSMATPQVAGEAALLMSAGVPAANVQSSMEAGTGLPTWIIKWNCIEDATSTPSNRSYTCTPDGVDWASTHKLIGAGLIQPLDAMATAKGLSQADKFPQASYGTAVAARPGTAAPSDLLVPKPVVPAVPVVIPGPDNLAVTGEHNGQLLIGWDAANGAAYYSLEFTDAAGAKAGQVYINHELHYAIVSGLANGTSYKARVQAVFSTTSKSAWTDWVSGTPRPTALTPAALTVSAINGGGAKLSWRLPTSPSPLTGVQVQVSEKANGTVAQRTELTGTAVNVTVDGLTRGVEYVAQFRASNAAGWSRWSSPMPFTPVGVAKVSGLAASAGNLSASLNWNADTVAASYRVRTIIVSAPAGVTTSRGSVSYAGSSAKIVRLTNGAVYDIDVAAVGADGRVGPYSAPVRVSAKQASGPVSVVAGAGGGYVSASFTPVLGAASYTVSVLNAAGTRVAGTTVVSTNATVRTGTVGQGYRVKVEAIVDSSPTTSSYSQTTVMAAAR